MFYFFFRYQHFLHLCAQFLILFHVTLIWFSRSTLLLMCLSLETLLSIIRTGELIWWTLLFLNDLSQMVNFPTCIPDCGSHSPALLDLYLLMLVFVLQWLFLHCETWIMSLSQFPLTFHHIHNRMPHFIALLLIILMLIGTIYMIQKNFKLYGPFLWIWVQLPQG